jgi:hypothetical protein
VNVSNVMGLYSGGLYLVGGGGLYSVGGLYSGDL